MEHRNVFSEQGTALGTTEYCNVPDLIMLREDLADELGAIIGYLECANQIRNSLIREQFHHAASEEAVHFMLLMQMVTMFDPLQAVELQKQGLAMLVGMGESDPLTAVFGGLQQSEDKRYNHQKVSDEDNKSCTADIRDVECLRNAIRDELLAINAYQRQIQAATNPTVQTLLIRIMNKEKEHVAEFTKLFYDIYH